jgi:hypothetical protein
LAQATNSNNIILISSPFGCCFLIGFTFHYSLAAAAAAAVKGGKSDVTF